MTENLILALEITALGMGLVFGAIMLLWLMMNLLTLLTAEKTTASPKGTMSDSAETGSVLDSETKARIAAIAVAVALAQEETTTAHPLSDPPTALVSAWQLGMRTKQLYQKGEPIKRQPRKIG